MAGNIRPEGNLITKCCIRSWNKVEVNKYYPQYGVIIQTKRFPQQKPTEHWTTRRSRRHLQIDVCRFSVFPITKTI